MIEKLECTCIEAYKTRKMRDPDCCACSCDHNDLVDQLAKANERVAEISSVLSAICNCIEYVDNPPMDLIDLLGEAQEQLRKEQVL